jgi:hypothetical protein
MDGLHLNLELVWTSSKDAIMVDAMGSWTKQQ